MKTIHFPKRLFVTGALLAMAASSCFAADPMANNNLPDGWLVSASEALEFKGKDGFDEPPMLRMRAVVPLIEILKPEPTADLKVVAPFAIQVQFRSQADAEIVPDSFRVLYGAFKLDITSRITKFVKVTPDGFMLDNAKIPPGKHRLTLQVQDSKQRVAERELRVEVE
jgi:hypothetical protein